MSGTTGGAALLRGPHVVLAVNMMDAVGYDEETCTVAANEVTDFVEALGLGDAVAIPVSAPRGDNVVDATKAMPWWSGPTLLGHLESLLCWLAEAPLAPGRDVERRVLRRRSLAAETS